MPLLSAPCWPRVVEHIWVPSVGQNRSVWKWLVLDGNTSSHINRVNGVICIKKIVAWSCNWILRIFINNYLKLYTILASNHLTMCKLWGILETMCVQTNDYYNRIGIVTWNCITACGKNGTDLSKLKKKPNQPDLVVTKNSSHSQRALLFQINSFPWHLSGRCKGYLAVLISSLIDERLYRNSYLLHLDESFLWIFLFYWTVIYIYQLICTGRMQHKVNF